MPADHPLNHTQMLELWPLRSVLARALGLNYFTLQSWEVRNSIPTEYWVALAAQAKKDSIKGVTLTTLLAAAERRKKEKPPRRNAAAAKTTRPNSKTPN